MPEMSGYEFSRAVLSDNPDQFICLMSGYMLIRKRSKIQEHLRFYRSLLVLMCFESWLCS